MLAKITLSADSELIQKAREKAASEKMSLNDSFRKWLQQYVQSEQLADEYELIMNSLEYVRAGNTFTREEMNER